MKRLLSIIFLFSFRKDFAAEWLIHDDNLENLLGANEVWLDDWGLLDWGMGNW